MNKNQNSRGPVARISAPVGAALVLCSCPLTAESSGREVPGQVIVAGTRSPVKAPLTLDCPAGLISARRGGSDPDRFSAPSDADRAAMTELVARLVTGGAAARASLGPAAAALGYSIDDVPEWPGTVLLRELPAQRRGGGAFVVRLARASELIVQAPHTFFDEGTLQLGCELFARASAAAFFIDTVHRYKGAQVDEAGKHPADVAHAPDSLFQAATEGMLRSIRKLTVVQVHGFALRESGPQVVLSEGTTRPKGDLPSRAQRALTPLRVGQVARFPEESPELGATTNVQGKLVRARDGRFLHVEMSSELRKNLLANGELRARFLDALARSLAGP